MVVSSLAAKLSPNSAFCHLAGGAMPWGGFSLDGNLHLHSWEIIGQVLLWKRCLRSCALGDRRERERKR